MEIEKEKRHQISWLLDFFQIDLKKLTRGELAKLAVELSTLISSGAPDVPDLPPLVEDVTVLSDIVPVASDAFVPVRRASNMAVSTFDLKRLDYQTFLNRGQTCLREFLETILNGIERMEAALHEVKGEFTEDDIRPMLTVHRFEIPQLNVTLRARFLPGNIGEEARLMIATGFETASLEDSIIFNAARLMENVPASAFHRCPECKKWFAHFSEREKRFCSNKCAARNGIRKSRAELKDQDPEKYEEELRAGAARARKSYERTIERGKPARRPTKHREE